uniref:Uncharacterized protein n=1 Tax=Anopheles atroparvus TaxID=41427 RepID=A0AAG5DS74_ANOAO
TCHGRVCRSVAPGTSSSSSSSSSSSLRSGLLSPFPTLEPHSPWPAARRLTVWPRAGASVGSIVVRARGSVCVCV